MGRVKVLDRKVESILGHSLLQFCIREIFINECIFTNFGNLSRVQKTY